MATVNEQSMIRPLSKIETWQTALHQLDAYHGTTVACQYRVPTSLAGPGHHEELRTYFDHALARTAMHHPFMRVGLADVDAKVPFWVEIEGIDLRRHITWYTKTGSESDFEELYLKSYQGFLDTNSPTFKGLLGGRWPYFERTKLSSTSSSAGTTEDISEYSLSFWFLASTIWREIAYPWVTGDQSSKALWSPIRTKPYETHRATARLSPTRLAEVLVNCRECNTTLTGLLHGITLVLFAKLLGPDKAKAFVSQTPLNQRRHTLPHSDKFPDLVPDDTMANYVSILMHDFNSNVLGEIRSLPGESSPNSASAAELERIIWTAATNVRADVQRQLDKGTKDDFCGLMKLIPDLRSHFRSELLKPRMPTWLVSNVGVLDGGLREKRDDGWTIQKAIISLGAYVNGPVCNLNVLSVLNGELAVDVSWQAGVLEDVDGKG